MANLKAIKDTKRSENIKEMKKPKISGSATGGLQKPSSSTLSSNTQGKSRNQAGIFGAAGKNIKPLYK